RYYDGLNSIYNFSNGPASFQLICLEIPVLIYSQKIVLFYFSFDEWECCFLLEVYEKGIFLVHNRLLPFLIRNLRNDDIDFYQKRLSYHSALLPIERLS